MSVIVVVAAKVLEYENNMLHNIKFELDFGIEYESAVPHNALHDARAIRDFYMAREARLQK